MSDSNIPAGSASGVESSATTVPETSNGQNTETTESIVTTPKVVSFKVAEQYKADMFKFKDKVRDLETKLGDMESQRLKENEDYKALYEREKAAAEAAKKKAEDLGGYLEQDKKFNEVRAEALQAGLRRDAVNDLELLGKFDGVQVEVTNTGRFEVHGAKDFVHQLKQSRPHWFSDTTAPQVNGGRGGAASPTAKTLSVSDAVAVERKYMRKEITRDQYLEFLSKYDKQKTI